MELMDFQKLREDLEAEKETLIAVATGTDINSHNTDYKRRRHELSKSLKAMGISDPNRWPDLWLWYEEYRDSPDLNTYQSRRVFILRAYQSVLDTLSALEGRQVGDSVDSKVTGWSKVDEKRGELKEKYRAAKTVEDFQGVGLICRSLMLAMSDAIFDPERHDEPESEPLKRGDTKGRIARVLAVDFPGEDGQRLRKLATSTHSYVQHVVHAETSDQTRSGIAADGTLFLISTLRRLIPEPVKAQPDPDPDELWEDYEPDPDEIAALRLDYEPDMFPDDPEDFPEEPPSEYLDDSPEPPPEWDGYDSV